MLLYFSGLLLTNLLLVWCDLFFFYMLDKIKAPNQAKLLKHVLLQFKRLNHRNCYSISTVLTHVMIYKILLACVVFGMYCVILCCGLCENLKLWKNPVPNGIKKVFELICCSRLSQDLSDEAHVASLKIKTHRMKVIPGTFTPYTLASSTQSTMIKWSATSVVATFSPFHLCFMTLLKQEFWIWWFSHAVLFIYLFIL